MTSVATRADLGKRGKRKGGKKRGARLPYVRPRGRDFAPRRPLSAASRQFRGNWLSSGYLALGRIIPVAFLSFFPPRRRCLTRVFGQDTPKSMGALGADGARCCLMMTFKCGAASFDCSRGAAGRDVFFSPPCFSFPFLSFFPLSLSIFCFLARSLLASFEISRSEIVIRD